MVVLDPNLEESAIEALNTRIQTLVTQRSGTVESVEGTLAGSRLVVAGAKGEILIPLATEICRTIDVAGKRIVIEPPEGLLDVNA